MRSFVISAVLGASIATPALADEKPVQLKKAPVWRRWKETVHPVTVLTMC